MRRLARRLPKSAPSLALLAAGESLLSVGLWLAWEPLAFLVAGAQVTAFALLRETGA